MKRVVLAAILTAILATPAGATTIPEFLKLNDHDQSIYLYGAISMLSLTDGIADGNIDRAQCIAEWNRGGGAGRVIAAVHLPPVLFKARFGFAPDDQGKGYVDFVVILLTRDACPAK